MTKPLKEVLDEKDQMYAEYVKDISLQFVERLSVAVGNVLFGGSEVSIIMEDINTIPQNPNYIAVVMIAVQGNETLEKEEVQMGNTISFVIPIDILEKGTSSDITEYLEALKDDQDASEKPVPKDTKDIEYAQRIIDRVNAKEREEQEAKKEQGVAEVELDDTQKALMELMRVTETRH